MWSGLFLTLIPLFLFSALISFNTTKKLLKRGKIKKEIFYPEEIYCNEPATLLITIGFPMRYLPACLAIHLSLIASEKRKIDKSISFSPGRLTNTPIALPPLQRGEYSGTISISLSDPFGFFKGEVCINEETKLLVLPRPHLPEETLRPLTLHSNISSQKNESSDELFEVRKYFPGDDPRKINWKMFSHSGELFLRTGESGTPQKKRIYTSLLLDSKIYISLLPSYIDQLIETYLGFLTVFSDAGKEIYSILPGEKDWQRVNSVSEYTPSLTKKSLNRPNLPETFPLPGEEEELFILMPEDSISAQDLLSKIQNNGHSIHLFTKTYSPLFPEIKEILPSVFLRKNSRSFFSVMKQYLLEKHYLKISDRRITDQKIRRGYAKKI